MFCSHCGVKVEGNPAACPNCGENIHSPSPKGMPTWLKSLVGFSFLGLLLALYFVATETDPLESVTGQLTALSQNKLTEAYYKYTSQQFQEATSLEAFKELVRANPIISNIEEVELIDKQEQDDDALLTLILTPSDQAPFQMQYRLKKIEDSWKIVAFKEIKAAVVPDPKMAPLLQK